SLSREERKRSLAIALDEVTGACPVVAGVYTDGTAEAVELARDAKLGGAAGVLVFPPTLFMWGAQQKPEMVIRHFSEIASAVDIPQRRLRVPAGLGDRLRPGDAGPALRDPPGGGGEGLVQRDRRLRAQPARAARERPAGGHAVVLHHVTDVELPARSRRGHLR